MTTTPTTGPTIAPPNTTDERRLQLSPTTSPALNGPPTAPDSGPSTDPHDLMCECPES